MSLLVGGASVLVGGASVLAGGVDFLASGTEIGICSSLGGELLLPLSPESGLATGTGCGWVSEVAGRFRRLRGVGVSASSLAMMRRLLRVLGVASSVDSTRSRLT